MNRRGFTLVEVMVATVILVTVMLSLSRLTGQFMHTTLTATSRTVAAEVASEQMERITTDPSYITLAATWAGTKTGFPNFSSMTRVTTVQRVTGTNPTRDYTVVTVRVTDPTMTSAVNMTTIVARP